jgi:hypothetical protein
MIRRDRRNSADNLSEAVDSGLKLGPSYRLRTRGAVKSAELSDRDTIPREEGTTTQHEDQH